MTTTNFSVPELAANQAQKYVTVNEALAVLDAAINLTVIRADNTNPPGSPSEGDKYIPFATAGGDWTGQEDNIACYVNAEWIFFTPQKGWRCYNQLTEQFLVFNGTSWVTLTGASGSNGGGSETLVLEEELTLSGATTTSTVAFPNQCIILGVSLRVTADVTGATTFDVGDGSTVDRFGGSIGISAGSTNQGTIGPAGNYASTTVTLTANGSNFTGGTVRIALNYISLAPPTS